MGSMSTLKIDPLTQTAPKQKLKVSHFDSRKRKGKRSEQLIRDELIIIYGSNLPTHPQPNFLMKLKGRH